MKENRYIRFDWAMKRLLRHKADHSVLEGFLTSLLNHPIKVLKLLESEGNQEYAENKYNRVDILAESADGEKMLIEVQNESEDAYFHRMLFGTSKLVTEYLRRGDNYERISKIYSINIVYFNLGVGNDYVYRGKTEFRGIHTNEILTLPERFKEKYNISEVSDIYPEYYVLRADEFDKWSSTPLDQWMYFLSTSQIPDDANAPGLKEAKEQLRIDSLSEEEKNAYYAHLDNMVSMRSIVDDARDEGIWVGMRKGFQQGIEQGALNKLRHSVQNMRKNGFDDATIANLLGESPDIIASI